MKILLLAENWPPRVGGIENYLTHIAENLPKDSVTVVAPNITGYSLPVTGYRLLRKHFFWPIIKPAWLPLFVFLFRLAKRENFDMLFCGKALFEGLVGYYLKKNLGIPYVVFTYAMEVNTWAADSRQRRKLERVLKSADRVVYINNETRRTLQKLGVTDKQLVKIWPGVDDRYFAEVSEEKKREALERYQIKQPYVLTVSRLIERKGIDVLIEAFGRLDRNKTGDVQLVIAGDGPQKSELKRRAGDKKVKFLGFVPDEDLPALYAGTALFSLTPRHVAQDTEGFGIVYLEAAAQGIPSVATSVGGAPEAVIPHETGLVVQPDSVEAARRALERLLSNDQERRKLGESAKKRAYDQFRWRKRILLVKGMIDAILAEQVLQKRKTH